MKGVILNMNNRYNNITLITINPTVVLDLIDNLTIEERIKDELLHYIRGSFSNVIDFVYCHLTRSLINVRSPEATIGLSDISKIEHSFTLRNNPCYEDELYQLDPYDVMCGKNFYSGQEAHDYEIMLSCLEDIHKNRSLNSLLELIDELYEPIQMLLWLVQLRLFGWYFSLDIESSSAVPDRI